MIDDQPIALLGGGEQAATMTKWLDDDLARADGARDRVPFLVVVHHRALYTTSSHADDSDVLDLRKVFAPIFDKHHVDLVVNGHDHAYERTKSLRPGAGFIEKATTFGGTTGFDGLYGVLTLDGRKLTMTSYGLTAAGTDPVIDTIELVK